MADTTLPGGLPVHEAARPRNARAAAVFDGTLPLVVLLAVVLGGMVLPPLWYLVQGSLHTTTPIGDLGDFTTRYYLELIQSPRFFGDLTNSFIFATGSMVLALLLGGVMAWLVERTNVACKSLATIAAVVSLGTPYLIYVIAWLFLLGKNGPVNDFLRAVTGSAEPLLNVYSMWGMIFVEGCLWSPMAYLLLAPIFRMSNADFEEAAQMAGANLWQTMYRISMRLAAPAFLGIALLTMIRAIEAFEVPILVGEPGGIHILTTEIYLDIQKRVPPNLGQASAFGTVLLVITAVLIYFYSRVVRVAERYQTVTGKGFRPRVVDLGSWRYVLTAVLVTSVVLVLVLPLAGLVWLALMPYTQSISVDGLRLVTLTNFGKVIGSSHYLYLVWITFIIAAGGATLVMVLTTLCGWLSVRRRRGAWILDQLAMVPLAFPGIVLGVVMLQQLLSMPFNIYGTVFAFIFAYGVRFLPYGMRYATAGMIQIHKELEESASVSGASLFSTFMRVVLPLCSGTIVAGWLFIFLLGARDLSMSVLLASPNVQPVAVALFDLWANGQGPELAAFGLVWTLVMTVLATLLFLAGSRTNGVKVGM